ncbi:MAG: hypothetical protein Q4F97_03675 [Bacteroidales bacterium]|nr:hypothetical protein [Bacteroidales bacterium]
MSEINKPLVKQSFEIIRNFLKSAVPPCTATVDTTTHYEVVAENNGQKHIYGYCIAHRNVVTLGFDENIPEEDFKRLIPKRLREMMNEHRRLEIREVQVNELRADIQDALNKLLYYFNEKNWYPI